MGNSCSTPKGLDQSKPPALVDPESLDDHDGAEDGHYMTLAQQQQQQHRPSVYSRLSVRIRNRLPRKREPMRASTYNEVHTLVDANLQEMAANRSKQDNGNAGKNHDKNGSGKRRRRTHQQQQQESFEVKQTPESSPQQQLSRTSTPLPLGVVGLQNMGNTCFLNSSLQCLSATIPLTDYFLGYNFMNEINVNNVLGTGGKLATAYSDLLHEIWNNGNHGNGAIRPVEFKQQLDSFAPQFSGRRQHDAQELLAFLLDGIHEDLNRTLTKPVVEDRDYDGTDDENNAIESWRNYLKRNKSLIVDIFQGQLRSKLRCLHCFHVNIKFEPFMYLSLPISDACTNLYDCLELYCQEELLSGDNQWYCSRCKQHRDATKKTDLWILPPILIVHLKRFHFNDYGQMASKNSAPIHYPVHEWNLTRYVQSKAGESPLYELYAVSNHLGTTGGGGHYTAYTLNRFDDQWYHCNDSTVHPVSVDRIQQDCANAYLLFYNRCSAPTSPGDNHTNSNNAESFSSGSSTTAATSSSSSSKQSNGRAGGGVTFRSQESMESTHSSSSSTRYPIVRRQSESRPDLWPHKQVRDGLFRSFSRRQQQQQQQQLNSPHELE